MAAAFRSSNASTYASRTNNTLTAPAGIQDGDVLLIAFLTGAAAAPTPTPPSGFTVVSGYPTSVSNGGFNVKFWVWTKAAASESGNYTVTHVAASSQGYICAASGATVTGLSATTNTGTGTTTTATGITTTVNSSLIVLVSHDWGTITTSLSNPTGTTPTFSTPRLNPGSTSGIMFVTDGVLTTAGATGSKTFTNNNGVSDPFSAGLVYIPAFVAGASLTSKSTFVRQAVNRASTY